EPHESPANQNSLFALEILLSSPIRYPRSEINLLRYPKSEIRYPQSAIASSEIRNRILRNHFFFFEYSSVFFRSKPLTRWARVGSFMASTTRGSRINSKKRP